MSQNVFYVPPATCALGEPLKQNLVQRIGAPQSVMEWNERLGIEVRLPDYLTIMLVYIRL